MRGIAELGARSAEQRGGPLTEKLQNPDASPRSALRVFLTRVSHTPTVKV